MTSTPPAPTFSHLEEEQFHALKIACKRPQVQGKLLKFIPAPAVTKGVVHKCASLVYHWTTSLSCLVVPRCKVWHHNSAAMTDWTPVLRNQTQLGLSTCLVPRMGGCHLCLYRSRLQLLPLSHQAVENEVAEVTLLRTNGIIVWMVAVSSQKCSCSRV